MGTGVGILGLMALLLVVTWNVRRLSVRETNRRRLEVWRKGLGRKDGRWCY